MATGKWLRADVPHSGWEFGDLEVLPSGTTETCEMCEREQIRYVQSMTHGAYPDTLRCGQICAGRMADDPETAKARERLMLGAAKRRDRRAAKGWTQTGEDSEMLSAKGFLVWVRRDEQDRSRWIGHVTEMSRGRAVSTDAHLRSLDEVKAATLDILMDLELRRMQRAARR